MSEEKLCGKCAHFHYVEGQPYHDCRQDSPKVIVPSFKPGDAALARHQVGKIMTVWPRVSSAEKGCGRFLAK